MTLLELMRIVYEFSDFSTFHIFIVVIQSSPNQFGSNRTALEPDRISVSVTLSAPKLPNFLVSAWFQLRP